MSKKVKLGVIGVGNMGTGHINHIMDGKCPEFEVTAVCDINPERLEWAKNKVPGVKTFEDAIEMLDSGLIDASLVSVPHYDHPRYAIASIERGIHVMVEKPAGVYTKQVAQMNKVADQHKDIVFGMVFNQRTDPVYRKMREMVQGGELGEIRRTSWIITDWYRPQAYYDSGAWRATWSGEGGGVLLNQCPHNLDLWQWICGMPTVVDSKMQFGKWHDIEVEDDVTTYVEYENGATGTFITSTGDAPGSNRFEVTLDGGKLVSERGRLKLWKLKTPEPEFSRTNKVAFAMPEVEEIDVQTAGAGDNSQHVGIMNAFSAAILRGEPLFARGQDGINGLTLSNAMHLSQWTDNPVTLPLDEDLFYNELMKRVKTSRRKEDIASVISDTTGTYGT